jgi:xylulokinase
VAAEARAAAFARLATVLLPKDYIRYRLTGRSRPEPSDASATLMYDTAHLRWSDEIMRAVELPTSLLPDVGSIGGGARARQRRARDAHGHRRGTPVVGGGRDNACGAAGVGVVAPGEVVTSWGTSGTVLAPTASRSSIRAARAHLLPRRPDTWYLMGVVLTAGGAFAWYQEQLARELAG